MAFDLLWIWWACVASATTCLLHVFVGGTSTAKPLLESDLGTVSKYTNYYCWHLVTITLAAMSIAYLVAALSPDAWELAIAATLLAGLFALWSITLNLIKKTHPLALPQWILFIPITIFGILGIA